VPVFLGVTVPLIDLFRPRIDYCFSFVSFWTRIGGRAFHQLVQRHNSKVVYKPVDLHEICRAATP
jgi:2-hydroxychromene-2-carboxylate isomerase